MGWGGDPPRGYSDLTETVAVTGARALARFRVILFADMKRVNAAPPGKETAGPTEGADRIVRPKARLRSVRMIYRRL